KEAEAVADHVKRVQAQWCACLPDAEAAIAAYEGRGPGRRGRQPQAWRYHGVRYRVVADTRRTRRARRGRPAKTDPPPTEAGYPPPQPPTPPPPAQALSPTPPTP